MPVPSWETTRALEELVEELLDETWRAQKPAARVACSGQGARSARGARRSAVSIAWADRVAGEDPGPWAAPSAALSSAPGRPGR